MQGYKLVKVPSQYIKNYNNRPYERKAYCYYISTQTETYSYKGVDVYTKHLLNKDGSEKGYSIEGISIKEYSKRMHYSDVRPYIDSLYAKLEEKLSSNQILCTYKLSNDIDDQLYSTAIDCLISKKYNKLQKRYILNDLIKQGLKKSDALNFLFYI